MGVMSAWVAMATDTPPKHIARVIVTRYREPTKQPCSDCPFRRNAVAGWLGEAAPESFIVEISMERPLPCHQTIDYEDKDWLSKWNAGEIGSTCAGALIMSANMCKLPRDRAFPRMEKDKTAVFPTHQAFLDHHNNAPVKSWAMDECVDRKKKR